MQHFEREFVLRHFEVGPKFMMNAQLQGKTHLEQHRMNKKSIHTFSRICCGLSGGTGSHIHEPNCVLEIFRNIQENTTGKMLA